jgi:Mlc titration factor MtfA (ptsG expression regulator)
MGIFSWLFGSKKSNTYLTFNEAWRIELVDHVPFYRALSPEQKLSFEERSLEFLNTTRITGIKTSVEELDKVLIAASAIIPIFGFPGWSYQNLQEVLLYPEHFDEDMNIGSKSKAILGMVGYGYMNGQMILSKKSLRHGFANETDKQNTAVHEFIHLIDKSDGAIDGVLASFKDKANVLPWINFMEEQIKEIKTNKSDIRAYGGTNRAEFLAVTGEYFFERPALMKKKEPVLYEYLEMMFGKPLEKGDVKIAEVVEHWDPCPCESGKKFRNCCS